MKKIFLLILFPLIILSCFDKKQETKAIQHNFTSKINTNKSLPMSEIVKIMKEETVSDTSYEDFDEAFIFHLRLFKKLSNCDKYKYIENYLFPYEGVTRNISFQDSIITIVADLTGHEPQADYQYIGKLYTFKELKKDLAIWKKQLCEVEIKN